MAFRGGSYKFSFESRKIPVAYSSIFFFSCAAGDRRLIRSFGTRKSQHGKGRRHDMTSESLKAQCLRGWLLTINESSYSGRSL